MIITATLLAYLHICPRKAWLHFHGIRMEQESEAVTIGKLIDQHSYRREKKAIDLVAEGPDSLTLAGKIDWINLREGVLHETKKGKSCEDAHLWQMRFYLWLLQLGDVTGPDGQSFTGTINYPQLKQTVRVLLLPEHITALNDQLRQLRAIFQRPEPPPTITNRAFCRQCAFEELCHG